MRKAALLLWLVILPVSLALTVTYSHYPLYPAPGDTVRVVMNLSGNATDVEMKLDHPLFRDDYWRDVGDVVGSASYVFYITLPDDLKPGLYEIPVILRFDEGNTTYTVPTSLSLRVVPPEGELDISLEGKPVAGRRSFITVTVVNNSDPLDWATLTVVPSLEGPIYLGRLEGRKEIAVEVLPRCEGGLEEFNVTLMGYREGPVSVSKTFVIPCIPTDPVRVESDLPREINQGYTPVRIRVFNPTDVPRTFYVVISSDAEVSGETQSTFTLDGRKSRLMEVIVKPREDQDTVNITVSVFSAEGNFLFSFSAYVAKEPDVVAYLREVKISPPTVVVEVANLGEGEARNVVVRSGEVTRFIGSLTGGDYDTAEFPLEGNSIDVTVSYTYNGERITREFSIPVKLPQRGSFPWWIALVILAAAIYLWRRKRDRSSTDGA